jgi:hypothetical protein
MDRALGLYPRRTPFFVWNILRGIIGYIECAVTVGNSFQQEVGVVRAMGMSF